MKKRIFLDPWSSLEITNYEKLFKEFGLSKMNSKLWLDHYLFKRNLVVAHREFEKVFNRIKLKKPFINMTGIASSGSLHMGHKMIIDLFLLFQKLGAKSYLAVADIDAYTSRPKIKSLDMAKDIAVNNIAHILALGIQKHAIYVQSKKEPRYYTFAFEISKKITEAMFKAVYGHLDLGKAAANMLQYADILHPQLKGYEGKMPTITVIGLEQDCHARLTKSLARRISYDVELPSFIYIRHQGGLQKGMKMSASEPYSAVFLDDSASEVKNKINRSFTGGRDTLAEQKKKGGKPDICKVYEFYKFHHTSDKFVLDIYSKCKKGKLMCKECKKKCVNFLNNFLKKHQAKFKKALPVARKMIE